MAHKFYEVLEECIVSLRQVMRRNLCGNSRRLICTRFYGKWQHDVKEKYFWGKTFYRTVWPEHCQIKAMDDTLWCQIRTARSLLGPVVEYPPCLFLWTMFFSFCTLWFLFRPCFSLQSPCGFYSDRVFSNCYIKRATVISDLRLVIPLWFLSGPRFSGSVPWGFYKEWDFCFLPPVVLQSLPMMFLFCPCAQSGTIE